MTRRRRTLFVATTAVLAVGVPIGAAMEFCEKRGIPWEKFLYGNEYDSEYKTFAAEYSKLAYRTAKTVHAVA